MVFGGCRLCRGCWECWEGWNRLLISFVVSLGMVSSGDELCLVGRDGVAWRCCWDCCVWGWLGGTESRLCISMLY